MIPTDEQGRSAVVVSAFRCRRTTDLLLVWGLHQIVRRDIRRHVDGFIGDAIYIDWRRSTLRTVSLWRDVSSIKNMGQARKHVLAVRVAGTRHIHTTAAVYSYAGDWREILFGSKLQGPDPITFAQLRRRNAHPHRSRVRHTGDRIRA